MTNSAPDTIPATATCVYCVEPIRRENGIYVDNMSDDRCCYSRPMVPCPWRCGDLSWCVHCDGNREVYPDHEPVA